MQGSPPWPTRWCISLWLACGCLPVVSDVALTMAQCMKQMLNFVTWPVLQVKHQIWPRICKNHRRHQTGNHVNLTTVHASIRAVRVFQMRRTGNCGFGVCPSFFPSGLCHERTASAASESILGDRLFGHDDREMMYTAHSGRRS